MFVRPISRLALLPALVSVLTVGNLVPPAEAAPSSRAVLSRSPDKRHRPGWMRFLDSFASGIPDRSVCGEFGCSAPCIYSPGKPDPAGGVGPTITIERFERLTFCFGGFVGLGIPILHITTLDGGVLGVGGESKDDAPNSVFSWNFPAEQVTAVMSLPGTYRYEVTADHTATTSGYVKVKLAHAPISPDGIGGGTPARHRR